MTTPEHNHPENEHCNKRCPHHVRNAPCIKCGAHGPQSRYWEAWGSYLDKDLKCTKCGHIIDDWDC